VAFCYGKSGGFLGAPPVAMRLVLTLSLRQQGEIDRQRFGLAWPHHPGGSWFWATQGWN